MNTIGAFLKNENSNQLNKNMSNKVLCHTEPDEV